MERALNLGRESPASAGLPSVGKIVLLRKLTEADVTDTYVAWLNDPEVNRYLEVRHQRQTRESVGAFVAEKLARTDEHLLAICDRSSGRHIGNLKIGPINPYHLSADLSLFIGERRLRGRGAGTEAVALATGWAFQTLRLRKLRAGIYAENIASIRAFERCGWQREGCLKGALVLDGRETDQVLYGIRRADYLAAGGKR